ncbi:MAG: DUF1203 domain-containing protein [Geminicoccaceae bacterium]
MILTNFDHQPANTPYRSAHAIYVRDGVRQAFPRPGEVPDMLRRRLLSVRAFDRAHDIVEAGVVAGDKLADYLASLVEKPGTAYFHLHFAAYGCFAASATRTW